MKRTSVSWDGVDLQLNKSGRETWPPGHALDRAWFRSKLHDHDFWFIWKGQGFFQIRNQSPVPLRRGVCLLLRPGDPCRAWQREGSQLGVIWIHFDVRTPTDACPLDADSPPAFFLDTSQAELFEAMAVRIVMMARELRFCSQPPVTAAHRWILQLLRSLLEGFTCEYAMQTADQVNGVQLEHRRMVSEALGCMHTQFEHIRSIREIARSLGYSHEHFSRIFAKATGVKPSRALMDIRMDKAKELLRYSHLGVERIAEQIGYHSVYAFSRQFKREIGSSPSSYRRAAGFSAR